MEKVNFPPYYRQATSHLKAEDATGFIQFRTSKKLLSLLLPILLAFTITSLKAQEAKPFEVIGKDIPANNSVFLAEIHGIKDLLNFRLALIKEATQKYNVQDVVMEIGSAEAYNFNSYFADDDTTIFIEYPEKENREYLRKWKDLYKEKKFRIVGVDFERMEFVIAVRSILEKNPETKSTELYKYIQSLTPASIDSIDGDKSGRKERLNIYGEACAIFKREKGTLQPLVKTGYQTLEDILENPASEKKMKQRDATMLENMLKTVKDRRFLCILGASHMDVHDKKSLLSRYIREQPTTKFSLVEMACKNCYNTSYYGEMFFPMNVGAAFKGAIVDTVEASYNRYYKPELYSLINQTEFKGLAEKYNPFPTYFLLFKDQPKMSR